MGRIFNRQELVGATPIWLLEITWAGRVYRFSSKPVVLTSDDGALPFHGGLEDLDYSEALDRLTTTPQGQTASLDLIFPINVAEQIAKGHDMGAASGNLAMVLEVGGVIQQAYEERQQLLTGRLTQPQYGAPDKPAGWAAFSLEQAPFDDAGLVLNPSHRINQLTWGEFPSYSEGKAYPLILGSPGKYTDADGSSAICGGSPGYVLNYSLPPLGTRGKLADKLLIAGHPVSATQVTVFDKDGASEVFNVTEEQDVMEVVVATVDVSAAAVIDRLSDEFWVGWHLAGGQASPFRADQVLTLAGDVCRFMLTRSSLQVDHGRWAALGGALDSFRVSTYVNDPDASPWEWLEDNLLPLLPISVLPGADGLWPVYYDREPKAVNTQAVVAGPGFQRTGPVTYERHPGDVINHFVLDYAKDAGENEPRRYLELAPALNEDDGQSSTNLFVKASASRYGTASEVTDTDVVYDTSTAAQVLDWWSRSRAFIPRTLPYVGGVEWGWLTVGDLLTLTDDDLHITTQLATVLEKAWTGTGWAFTLLIDDDITRDLRAT